jgi:hypothetical protein
MAVDMVYGIHEGEEWLNFISLADVWEGLALETSQC